MRTHYGRASDRERKVVQKLRAQGYISVRSAGSHSPIDVWAINPETKTVLLVQCKPRSMLKKDGTERAVAQRITDDLAKLDGVYKVLTKVQFSHQRFND